MRTLYVVICTAFITLSSAYANSVHISIYDEIIPHKSSQSIAAMLKNNDMLHRYSKVLSEEEYRLFEAYFNKNFSPNKIKKGTTVAQAIESERRTLGLLQSERLLLRLIQRH